MRSRSYLSSFTVLALLGCATSDIIPVTQDIEFRIVPDGTQISVVDSQTNNELKNCVSPCTVTVNVTRDYEYSITRDGMADKIGTIKAKFDHAGYARDFTERNKNSLPATYIEGYMESPAQRQERLAAMPPMKRRMSMFMEAYKSRDLRAAVDSRDVKPVSCPPTETYLKPGDLERIAMIPPILPAETRKSGHCMVQFDVNTDGEPVNLRADYCTEDHFETPSIGAVAYWLFEPKVENGEAVPVCGVETKMTFILKNEIGKVVPE